MVRDVVHGIRVAETSNLQIGVRSIFDGQYHTPRKRQSNRELKSYKGRPKLPEEQSHESLRGRQRKAAGASCWGDHPLNLS